MDAAERERAAKLGLDLSGIDLQQSARCPRQCLAEGAQRDLRDRLPGLEPNRVTQREREQRNVGDEVGAQHDAVRHKGLGAPLLLLVRVWLAVRPQELARAFGGRLDSAAGLTVGVARLLGARVRHEKVLANRVEPDRVTHRGPLRLRRPAVGEPRASRIARLRRVVRRGHFRLIGWVRKPGRANPVGCGAERHAAFARRAIQSGATLHVALGRRRVRIATGSAFQIEAALVPLQLAVVLERRVDRPGRVALARDPDLLAGRVLAERHGHALGGRELELGPILARVRCKHVERRDVSREGVAGKDALVEEGVEQGR